MSNIYYYYTGFDAISDVLTEEQEKDYFREKPKTGCTPEEWDVWLKSTARRRLIEANTRLVFRAAKGKKNSSELIDFLFVQLIKSVDGFEPDKGYRFATYAIWGLNYQTRSFYQRVRQEFPLYTDVVDVPLELGPLSPDLDLDTPLDTKQLVSLAVEKLSERERTILLTRYEIGTESGKPRPTLAQIGETWGITRERVRQIEAEALEKAGNALLRLGIRFGEAV